MKKSKQCPKCESLKIWWLSEFPTSPYALVTYVCVECGYSEVYKQRPAELVATHTREYPTDRRGWVNPQPGEQGPYR